MHSLVLLVISFFFISCGSISSLTYTSKKIKIDNTITVHTFNGSTLYSNKENFGQLFISQYVFLNEYKELLVFEKIDLDTHYKFKFSYTYTLENIFKAKSVERKKSEAGLEFFIIKMYDGTSIYCLLKTGTRQSLTMIYGFSKENFKALMQDTSLTEQYIHSTKPKDAIKTLWSHQLIISGVLLERKVSRPVYR